MIMKYNLFPFGTGGKTPIGAGANTGSYDDAYAMAQENPTVTFSWLLKETDSSSNEFTQMIWHIGNGVFVDAIGTVVSNLYTASSSSSSSS